VADPNDAVNELNLEFPDADHVIVTLQRNASRRLPFVDPLNADDHRDLRWYLEIYGAHSLGDPDDKRAQRVAARLPELGRALFQAALGDPEAQLRYSQFLLREQGTRLLTISAEHPAILALPWELLHGPAAGSVHLFLERPPISVRRRVLGASDGRAPFDLTAKDTLHLLFVVSRPLDAGFLDPRADTAPILDAIDEHAPGRVVCEFLRPPTFDALIARLDAADKPPIDILHFDGHGVFDRHGDLPRRLAEARIARGARIEDILRDEKQRRVDAPCDPHALPDTGYLLFEAPDRNADPVSARKLGENLHRRNIALTILSACQSAAIGGSAATADDPAIRGAMGSVAARLTATGIPSVLAMTHSVLIHTTRMLFGAFYKELATRRAVGASLDLARRHLLNHPERYEVQREQRRVPLALHDWFLPALYQPGDDGPLLAAPSKRRKRGTAAPAAPRSNVARPTEVGFYGRKLDLWNIERWFADGARRISLTGFGGQGKTALAHEAARWLLRTGMFAAAVFVDYAAIQSVDAVAVAVRNIGEVLGDSLLDADAAAAALRRIPTLVILDNLEVLPPAALHELLAAAVPWSGAGGSRVLCTTRRPTFDHPDYRVEGTLLHRRIQLTGLGSVEAPDDALELFAAVHRLPPAPLYTHPREALIELFALVEFHPLSIRVLAQQLKTRRPADLGQRLETLLAAPHPHDDPDAPPGLLASLRLSLDRLDAAARQALPSLGVFHGGAFEDDLVAITGLGGPRERARLERLLTDIERGDIQAVLRAMNAPTGADTPPELLARVESELPRLSEQVLDKLSRLKPSADIWPSLRQQLEAAALLEVEAIPGVGVPYLRFHPTLAPMLWAELAEADRVRLNTAHHRRYYQLSEYLYHEDSRNVQHTRAIAGRELPNLLHAACAALAEGAPEAGSFVKNMVRFLTAFGLKHEAALLIDKAQQSLKNDILVQTNLAARSLDAGRIDEATDAFQAILARLGDAPTFRRATTLGHLGRCYEANKQLTQATQAYRDSIAVCDQLPDNDDVKRHRGAMLGDIGDILSAQGRFSEAHKLYESCLKIGSDLGDLRSQAVALSQLGGLASRQSNPQEALERYNDALVLMRTLGEPLSEATMHHSLGVEYQEMRRWDDAERHYRQAARITEEHNHITGPSGAASTWAQLGALNLLTGRPQDAEDWFRKALAVTAKGSAPRGVRSMNLATTLYRQPGRLTEARALAEEARAIKQVQDPNAGQIWKVYGLLADIAAQEAQETEDATLKLKLHAEARDHRRQARDAKRAFPGTRHELREFLPLILATLGAVNDGEQRSALDAALSAWEQRGWSRLVAAIRHILDGERDTEALCEPLDVEDSMVIETILHALTDPSSLADLQDPPAPAPSESP